jgi:thiol-disulfide isomerase/thioredoxin
MSLIIVLVRLMLSAVFGVASVTKLLDQPGTREAVTNFGAPRSFSPSVAVVLPTIELAIAVGLLFTATAWWSALAALFVLGVFVVAISVNLARGKTHECHCFGQIYSRPLGWPTLVRNMVFVLAVVMVLWNGRASQANIVSTIAEKAAELSTWQALLLVVGMSAAVAGVFYFQRRRKLEAVHDNRLVGLPLDSEAPAFDLPAYDGGRTSLTQLLDIGKPILLIFINPRCGPCIQLFQEIKDWQAAHNDQLTITLVSIGTIKDNFVNVARNRLGQVLLQEKSEVAKLYGATATPTAVIVNTDGRIASHIAAGSEEIRSLLQSYVQPSNVSYEAQHQHGPTRASGIQSSPAIR